MWQTFAILSEPAEDDDEDDEEEDNEEANNEESTEDEKFRESGNEADSVHSVEKDFETNDVENKKE